MEQKIVQHINDIEPVATAHKDGKKFVFLKNDDSITALTQFAYGSFKPGEFVAEHVHKTMEECFFFLKGEGRSVVNGNICVLKPGTFLRVPAGARHTLEAGGGEVLEFVYFGIAMPAV